MSDGPKPSEIPTDREGRPFYADRLVVTRPPAEAPDQSVWSAAFNWNGPPITAAEFAERSGSLAADEVLREALRPVRGRGFSVSGRMMDEAPETSSEPIDIGPGGLVAHVDPHAAVREVRAYATRHQGSSVLLVINGAAPSSVVRQLFGRHLGWSTLKIGRSTVHVRQFWDGTSLQLRGEVHHVCWLFDPTIHASVHERSLAEEARQRMATSRAKHVVTPP